MSILYAFLIATIGLVSLIDASAIKGHARPHEESRSIKLAPASNNLDKGVKVQPQQQAPSVPILESTKKIYNDESIRRLVVNADPAGAYPVQKPVDPVIVPAVQQAPIQSVPPKQSVAESPSAVASVPVSVPEAIQQVAPVQQAPIVEQPIQPAAVIKEAVEPKSAPVEQAPAKQAEVLPQPSDRSAPIRNELPLLAQPVAPSVVVVEQPVVVPKNEQEVAAKAPVVEPQQAASPIVVAPAGGQQATSAEVVVPVVSVQAQQPEPVQVVKNFPLEAKKDDTPAVVAPMEPLLIEVPAPDPGLVLSEPIDSTTKLLIDLDEHVRKFLPAEDQQQAAQPQKDQTLVAGIDYSPASVAAEPSGKSSGPLAPYSSSSNDDSIVPPLPSLDGVEKASAVSGPAPASASQSVASGSSSASSSPSATRQGGQNQNQQQVITQLLDQLDSLQNRIQDTINQLVSRRRYVMSALLRPMGTYVRRVRTNLERLQNRVNQLQAAAVSVGGGQNRPGGFVDAAAIETIRRRIDDISKRISDIVNRIRFSLTPTSAPMNSNGRK